MATFEGRGIRAVATEYKGVRLKSRLEADAATLIDAMVGLTRAQTRGWEYEPRSFTLAGGIHYQPDFWVPSMRLWVECRGESYDRGDRQIEAFMDAYDRVEPQGRAYLVVGPDVVRMMVRYPLARWMVVYPQIGVCPNCQSWAFDVADRCLRCWTPNALHSPYFLAYQEGLRIFAPKIAPMRVYEFVDRAATILAAFRPVKKLSLLDEALKLGARPIETVTPIQRTVLAGVERRIQEDHRASLIFRLRDQEDEQILNLMAMDRCTCDTDCFHHIDECTCEWQESDPWWCDCGYEESEQCNCQACWRVMGAKG